MARLTDFHRQHTSAVPVEDLAPGTQEAAGGAPEPMEVAVEEAAATTGGERECHQNRLWR
jgi:hypothetical protein